MVFSPGILTVGLGALTGQRGPCTPTGNNTNTDYVYVMDIAGDKIRHMTKIWNAGEEMKELGCGSRVASDDDGGGVS